MEQQRIQARPPSKTSIDVYIYQVSYTLPQTKQKMNRFHSILSFVFSQHERFFLIKIIFLHS